MFNQGTVAAMLWPHKDERPQGNGREAFCDQICANDHSKTLFQFTSTTRAPSPWHSEHKPTCNKSPLLTAPVKLLMVTSWRHFPHQKLESNCFLATVGMPVHRVATGPVKLGIDSMLMNSVQVHSQKLSELEDLCVSQTKSHKSGTNF